MKTITIQPLSAVLGAAVLGAIAGPVTVGYAQAGTIVHAQKVSSTQGGFGSGLNVGDGFGTAVASLGDLDGDGIIDYAVGAPGTDSTGTDLGSVWIVFMKTDGTVKAKQEITEGLGGFGGNLDDGDGFGCALAPISDLDGDGLRELAAGARGDDDGGTDCGAIWVLFLQADGLVKDQQKISSVQGGLSTSLDGGDSFGFSLACIGDRNGDGSDDLAVGSPNDDDGGSNRGAAYILYLAADGSVWTDWKISALGGFGGVLNDEDHFGSALCPAQDLNGDGLGELLVATHSEIRQNDVWFLRLSSSGVVQGEETILSMDPSWGFGVSLTTIGDLDGDGLRELAVGEHDTATGGTIWIYFFLPDGTLKPGISRELTRGMNGWPAGAARNIGAAAAWVGDMDGDGLSDLLVGERDDGPGPGAVWTLFLDCLQAEITVRNGGDSNPWSYTSLSMPVFGTAWETRLNCVGHSPSIAMIIGYDAPSTGLVIGAGELLVDVLQGAYVFDVFLPHAGDVVGFSPLVPDDVSLRGFQIYTQGICFGSPGGQLSNAIDIVIGR